MLEEDRLKIVQMRKNGMSLQDVCHRYRHRYPAIIVTTAFNKRGPGRPRKTDE